MSLLTRASPNSKCWLVQYLLIMETIKQTYYQVVVRNLGLNKAYWCLVYAID